MKNFFNHKKNIVLFMGILFFIILFQGFVIAKLYSERNDKVYEVNLMKVSTQKDSLDLFKLKNDLTSVDRIVRNINNFLRTKNASNLTVEALSKDSLANSVYLSNQSARYSQYLENLEKKLQQVPLGIPVDGYISSNFGKRKNPIPSKKLLLASIKPISLSVPEEKDSSGNIINKNAVNGAKLQDNKAASEADQMQFHKGIDIAANYGSNVLCAAQGKVIFAGQKGGYGNCVIVNHGNGLATLYGHLSQIMVKPNQEVKVGETIAKSGNSGRSTGPHLHYEVHKNNAPVNPRLFLNF